MKPQQPQTHNGQQQGQVDFENIMLTICLLLSKVANKTREFTTHDMFQDRQARAMSGSAGESVDMTGQMRASFNSGCFLIPRE